MIEFDKKCFKVTLNRQGVAGGSGVSLVGNFRTKALAEKVAKTFDAQDFAKVEVETFKIKIFESYEDWQESQVDAHLQSGIDKLTAEEYSAIQRFFRD